MKAINSKKHTQLCKRRKKKRRKMSSSSSSVSSSSLIIFLDVDGVLVPVSPMSFGGGDFDNSCIDRLGDIVDLAGGADHVTIVISSTWRHDPSKMQRLNDAFSKCLSSGGSGMRRIPAVSLGVSNGVPNPTLQVGYLKKDPSEQKLVKERVDEICYFLEQHMAGYPAANISVIEPPPVAAAPAATEPPPQPTATPADDDDKKKKKKGGNGGGGGPPAPLPPMKSYPGRWFAIDDMDLGVDSRMHAHFLKTDIEEGITTADVAKAQLLVDGLIAPAVIPGPSETTAAAAAAPVQGSNKKVSSLPLGVPLEGVVKRYNPNRGFGFLRCNGEDIFVHQLHVLHEGFRGLNVAEPVRFEISVDAETGRLQAVKVQQLSEYRPSCKLDLVTGMTREAGAHHQAQLKEGGGGGADRPRGRSSSPSKTKVNNSTKQADSETLQPSSSTTGGNASATLPPPPPAQAAAASSSNGEAHVATGKKKKRGRGAGAAVNGLASGNTAAGAAAPPPVAPWHPVFGHRPVAPLALPLIPDGFGFRSANGTVFYPVAPPPPPPYVEPEPQPQEPSKAQ